MYTEYLYTPDYIAGLVKEKSDNLKANRGLSDLLGFGLSIVRDRLSKDPKRYRDYGPYWWSLKELLNSRGGGNYGKEFDSSIASIYKGKTPVETLVIADEFRTMYLKIFFKYTNRFVLNSESEEFWTLFDKDMEVL